MLKPISVHRICIFSDRMFRLSLSSLTSLCYRGLQYQVGIRTLIPRLQHGSEEGPLVYRLWGM